MQFTKSSTWRRPAAAAGALVAIVLMVMSIGGSAGAAIVPTVPLATAAQYSVLASSTVTNTGASVLAASVGLSPGTVVTGFPPATIVPPGTMEVTTAAAAQAQSDLDTAYVNAAGRSIDATTPADLANQHLGAGVYATSSSGALGLTGPLVLDGAGDPTSVFIFKTNSSLTTASSSTVTLVNGAQECNVFWQVGSSATLGTGSIFRGNILAQASVTVTTAVTVHGRAMARTGAVTLDTDTFVNPTCATTPVTTTTATTTTATTAPGGASTPASSAPAAVDATTDATNGNALASDDSTDLTGSGQETGELAQTGVPIGLLIAAGVLMIITGIVGVWVARTAP